MIIRNETPEKEALELVKRSDHALVDVSENKDIVTFTNMQYVLPIKQAAQALRQDDNNGFTKDRQFRLIGTVPVSELIAHPELLKDENEMKKFLRGEGKCYATVRKGI